MDLLDWDILLMLVGLVGILSEMFYLGGRTRPWIYYTHGFISRGAYTIGVVLAIHSSDLSGWQSITHISIMVFTVGMLGYFQRMNMENYKAMRKARQELDELLDKWRK